jgi:FG-GAP-like repeat
MRLQLFFWGTTMAFTCLLLSACQWSSNRKNSNDPALIQGQALAAKYCQSCHVLPDPNWVDATTWEKGILPMMGPRLGIFSHQGKRYKVNKYEVSITGDFYPTQPLLTEIEWQKIIDYYVRLAPEKPLPQNRSIAIGNNLKQFEVLATNFKDKLPATSYVKIDTANHSTPFVITDALNHFMYRFDAQLNLVDSFKTKGPIVNRLASRNNWLLCDIGILNPDNGANGSIKSITLNQAGGFPKEGEKTLLDRLQRPVQFESVDLNADGRQDLLVCEFGYLTGALNWYENKKEGGYEKHSLRAKPGAIKAVIQDYNHDGLPDIWVLFAQGEEGIYLYTNLGKGKFKEDPILRFPPINGSSYFELADFNKDGFDDIIYTCGDNADYSLVLKAFHGVYVYLNDGKNNFTQKYFYPLNGCYKAIARDFDKDGDLDLATISYFADFEHQPEEGFVYLENKGNYNFTPTSASLTQKGRWLTMDAGDYNQDGYLDLILGNFSVAPSFIPSKIDWKKGPPFIVLKNRGASK